MTSHEHRDVSDHRKLACLFNSLLWLIGKNLKASRSWLNVGYPSVTSAPPSQRTGKMRKTFSWHGVIVISFHGGCIVLKNQTIEPALTRFTPWAAIQLINGLPIAQSLKSHNASHNALFCDKNVHTCVHFCYKKVHFWIQEWWIMGLVQQVYLHSVENSLCSHPTPTERKP